MLKQAFLDPDRLGEIEIPIHHEMIALSPSSLQDLYVQELFSFSRSGLWWRWQCELGLIHD